MTNFKRYLTLFLFALFTAFSVHVWGALVTNYTYTFGAKQFEDNTTAKTLGTLTWTPATSWRTGSGYWGYDATKGQQWGSGSNGLNTLTLTAGSSISNIKKITINASTASSGYCKLSVKVGSTAIGSEQTLSTSATDYNFENATGLTGIVQIKLVNNSKDKAQYIKSITIYTEGSATKIDATLYYKGTSATISDQDSPYTLPTSSPYGDDACSEWKFDGWLGSTYAKSTTKPSPYITQLSSTGNAYAVYKNTEGGGSETFTPANSGGWGSSRGSHSGTIGNYTVATSDGLCSTEFRTYSGSTFTISCSSGNITSISFTPSSGYYTSNLSTGTGTLTGNEWTGNASSVSFSASAQVRFDEITVSAGTTYYSTTPECNKCALPTFSPDPGTYTSTQSVTISCSTPGAAIHYTTNGSDPTGSSPTYSSPISVSSTTTIKAIAIKAGLDNSAIASATYTIVDAEIFTLVTDAGTLEDGDEIIILNDGDDRAMSTTQNTNNRGYVAASAGVWEISGTTVTVYSTEVQVLKLIKNASTWALYDETKNGYLYAASSSSNYLRTQTSNDANGLWEISITTGIASLIAQGSNTHNVMQYNSGLFACYTAASYDDLKLYRKEDAGTKYNVTVSIPAGHGTATQSNSKIKESIGKVTITCLPDAGYVVNTVTTSNGTITPTGVENEYQLTGVTANATVTISYRKLWEVTYTTDGHGSVSLNTPYADTGGSVTLTLTPHAGYGDPTSVTATSGTATITGSSNSYTISGIGSDVELSITFTKQPVYTVHFNAGNGSINGDAVKDIKETYRGNGVIAPIATPFSACSGDWEFAYWSTFNQTSETSDAPTHTVNGNDKYIPASDDITLYAIYRQTVSSGVETTVTDVFTLSTTGVSGTSYTDWENVDGSASSAVYAGNNAGGNSAIQMRTKNSTSGIISTTSGGKIRNVTVTWNNNTSAGRKVSIWGSNEAYTAPSDLYATATRGTGLGTIDYGGSTSLDIEGDYAYVGIRSTGDALYLDQINLTWATGTSATYNYCTSPTCEACTEATHKFTSSSVVLTYPYVGTYTNTFTTDNTGSKKFSSSDKGVATVNSATGEVTIVGLGTTTISVHIGKTAGKCAVDDSYEITVKEPTIQVVEVTSTDDIIIEHDFGGSTNALLDQLVTHEDGNVADEVFFSKYYEASSNVKLVAIYNGTGINQDPTKLRVRIVNGTGSSKHIVNLKDYFTASDMPNGKEIILYSWNTTNATDIKIMNCADDKADMSSWIAIPWSTYTSTLPGIIFGGDEAVVLEKTEDEGVSWEIMDIIGALNADGSKADASATGTATWADNPGWYTLNGNQLGVTPETNDYGIGTTRCLLVRKFDVLSGANARNKTTGNWGTGDFKTLASEWYGKQVGKASGEYLNSCNAFSEVGNFNYYEKYTKFESLNTDAFTATDNGDGTMTIHINLPGGLASLACNFLKIKVTNAAQTQVLEEIDYRVPIIVTGDKTTNDAIFTSLGTGDDACRLCDVAILQNATLTPHASGKNILHNIEIYRGAKLTIPSDRTLTIDSLIMRSKGDIVPQADIQGTLNRFDTKLFFDKRVDETRWYWMTLPYDCDMGDVILKDQTKPTYGEGKDWVLKYYDGQKRANTQSGGCWTVLPEGSTIQKGKGYILGVTPKTGHDFLELRFPMTATAWDKDPSRASIAVPVMATKSEGITPNHVGWNLVGNPYITHYKPSYIGMDHANNTNNLIPLGILEPDGEAYKRTNNGVRYVVIPQNGGYAEYSQVAIGDKPIETFMSYFIQIGGTADTEYAVDFKYANSRHGASMPIHRAPAEYMDEPDNHPVWIPITLTNVLDEQDETTFLVSDQFTDNYDMMDDLVKMRGTYYQYPQITTKPVLASRNNEGEMAFNALPDASAEAGIPLNYFASSNGNYTIALSEKYGLDEVKEVQLFDKVTNEWYDLMADSYTFYSNRTDNTDRFILSVRVERKKTPQIATDIDNIGSSDGPRKLLIDGNIYIQRGNRIYDITGKQAVLQ